MPGTWQESLARAGSEKEVLIIVRDFIARLDAAAVRELPAECRPGKFFDAEDVGAYRFELLRHHLSREAPSPHTLLTLIEFFSQAGDRLRELASCANENADSDD